jgi:ketosteroid isomerase-like protein
MQLQADLIRTFYGAFQRRDHAAMAACYAPDAAFSDPVFRDLRGARIGAMWRMLCERGTDLRIEASGIEADIDRGRARWDAWYTFSATGRPVHNIIQASFQFRDGFIQSHIDSFDLYAWARQALGLKGLLLGWTPFVQSAIRSQAARGLDAFIRKHGLGGGKGVAP